MVCLCSIPEIASEDFLNGIKDPIYEVAKNKTKKRMPITHWETKCNVLNLLLKAACFPA